MITFEMHTVAKGYVWDWSFLRIKYIYVFIIPTVLVFLSVA